MATVPAAKAFAHDSGKVPEGAHAIAPMVEKPKQSPPNLVQTSDCSVSVQARVQTATFNVDANITAQGFAVARIQRKNSGGEIWPMTDKEALEYSAAIASFSATAQRLQQQLKEFRL